MTFVELNENRIKIIDLNYFLDFILLNLYNKKNIGSVKMDLRKMTYIEMLSEAHKFADYNDMTSLLEIKKELTHRINSKQEKDKSPSYGSLMGFYEICSIIESINE